MPFSRGDVVLVNFPFADLKRVKRRPALVVQANNLNTGFTHCILAMISSQMIRAGHPCRITIKHGDPLYAATNLLGDSVIVTDHLATIEEAIIAKKLGVVSDMTPVDAALRVSLAL